MASVFRKHTTDYKLQVMALRVSGTLAWSSEVGLKELGRLFEHQIHVLLHFPVRPISARRTESVTLILKSLIHALLRKFLFTEHIAHDLLVRIALCRRII